MFVKNEGEIHMAKSFDELLKGLSVERQAAINELARQQNLENEQLRASAKKYKRGQKVTLTEEGREQADRQRGFDFDICGKGEPETYVGIIKSVNDFNYATGDYLEIADCAYNIGMISDGFIVRYLYHFDIEGASDVIN
jgi:hypothetical protein